MRRRLLVAAFFVAVAINLGLLFYVVHDHWYFEEPEWQFFLTALDGVTSRLGQGLVGVSIVVSLYAGLMRSPEVVGEWVLQFLRLLTNRVSVLVGMTVSAVVLAYLFLSGVRFHPPISQDSSSVLITPDGSEVYVALATGKDGMVLWQELHRPEGECDIISMGVEGKHPWHSIQIGQETGRQEPFTWTAGKPSQLAYVQQTDQILVTDLQFNSIVVISRRLHRAIHIISGVGFAPRSIVVTADGHKAYVGSEQPIPTGRIAVIDLTAKPYPRLMDTAMHVPSPQGMAIRGRRLYVATQSGAGQDAVFMVDTATDRILDWVPGFATGMKVAIVGESGETLYVSRGESLGTLDISHGRLQLSHLRRVAARGVIAATEDRRTALLDTGGQLTAIDPDTDEGRDRFSVAVDLRPSDTPVGLAISRGRAYAWSPGAGHLCTFDLSSPPQACCPPPH